VAKQGEDPDVIAATMAAPGVVLKPPVGSHGAFKEHAELPTDLARDGTSRKPGYTSASQKPHRHPPRTDRATDRKAALAIEKEQKRRDGERRRQEAARQRIANGAKGRPQKPMRRWTMPTVSMRRRPPISRQRSRLSRSDRAPRTTDGKGKKNGPRIAGTDFDRIALTARSS
jgi:hypothetical protein